MREENESTIKTIDEVEIIANIGDIENNLYKYKFAIRLTQLMQEKNITPKVLAYKSDIAPNTISKYRHGNGEPQLSILAKMAKALNVSIDYLSGLSEYKGSSVEDYDISIKTGLSYEAIEVLKEYNSKYHNYIPTINFLLEQELLPLVEEKIAYSEDTIPIDDYKEFEMKLNSKKYIPIIDTIHQYFTTKSQNELLSINNGSMIIDGKKINVVDPITKKRTVFTRQVVTDEELINTVYLENIKNRIKQAKQKYTSQFPSEVDNQ